MPAKGCKVFATLTFVIGNKQEPYMELGLYTFVEAMPDAVTGEQISGQQRMQNLLEEIQLADELGLMYLASASITAKNI